MKNTVFFKYDLYATVMKRNNFVSFLRKYISINFFFLFLIFILVIPPYFSFRIAKKLISGELHFNYSSKIVQVIKEYPYILVGICISFFLYFCLINIKRLVYEMQQENFIISLSSLTMLNQKEIEQIITLKYSLLLIGNNVIFFFPILILISYTAWKLKGILLIFLFFSALCLMLLMFIYYKIQYLYNNLKNQEKIKIRVKSKILCKKKRSKHNVLPC
jgi:hypothetical protein